jgi:hypothetical protein
MGPCGLADFRNYEKAVRHRHAPMSYRSGGLPSDPLERELICEYVEAAALVGRSQTRPKRAFSVIVRAGALPFGYKAIVICPTV